MCEVFKCLYIRAICGILMPFRVITPVSRLAFFHVCRHKVYRDFFKDNRLFKSPFVKKLLKYICWS